MVVEQNFSFYSATPNSLNGISSYTDSFVSAYALRYPEHLVRLHTNCDVAYLSKCAKLDNVQFEAMPAVGILPYKIKVLIAQTALAWRLRGAQRPLISTTPLTSLVPFVPLILTIHDMYDVDRNYRGLVEVLYFRVYFFIVQYFATAIICVSDTTRQTALPFIRACSSILVIKEASKYNVADDLCCSSIIANKFLYVANVQLTKNFGCLVKMAALAKKRRLDIQVVWVGRDPLGIAAGHLAGEAGLDNIQALGGVPEDKLRNLYQTSAALIVTSWTEGFCLPVLEAQSQGCPVIASDIPILREVAGPHSYFFPPDDPEAGLAIVEQFLLRGVDRVAAGKAALTNARNFSWEAGAEQLEAFLK